MNYKDLLKRYLQYIYLEDVDCVVINGEDWQPTIKLSVEEKLELRTLHEVKEEEGLEEGLIMGAIETIQFYNPDMYGTKLAEELRRLFDNSCYKGQVDIEYWIKYFKIEEESEI